MAPSMRNKDPSSGLMHILLEGQSHVPMGWLLDLPFLWGLIFKMRVSVVSVGLEVIPPPLKIFIPKFQKHETVSTLW